MLAGMGEGDRIHLNGPLGHPFELPENPDTRILMVGGGIGLAPFLQEELIFLDEACEFETGADAAVVEGGAGVAGYGIVLNLDDGFIAKGIRLVLLNNDARPLPVKGLLSACTCGAYRG